MFQNQFRYRSSSSALDLVKEVFSAERIHPELKLRVISHPELNHPIVACDCYVGATSCICFYLEKDKGSDFNLFYLDHSGDELGKTSKAFAEATKRVPSLVTLLKKLPAEDIRRQALEVVDFLSSFSPNSLQEASVSFPGLGDAGHPECTVVRGKRGEFSFELHQIRQSENRGGFEHRITIRPSKISIEPSTHFTVRLPGLYDHFNSIYGEFGIPERYSALGVKIWSLDQLIHPKVEGDYYELKVRLNEPCFGRYLRGQGGTSEAFFEIPYSLEFSQQRFRVRVLPHELLDRSISLARCSEGKFKMGVHAQCSSDLFGNEFDPLDRDAFEPPSGDDPLAALF